MNEAAATDVLAELKVLAGRLERVQQSLRQDELNITAQLNYLTKLVVVAKKQRDDRRRRLLWVVGLIVALSSVCAALVVLVFLWAYRKGWLPWW